MGSPRVSGQPGRLALLQEGLHALLALGAGADGKEDRKSTRLNSSHSQISYAVFCLKKKKKITKPFQGKDPHDCSHHEKLEYCRGHHRQTPPRWLCCILLTFHSNRTKSRSHLSA